LESLTDSGLRPFAGRRWADGDVDATVSSLFLGHADRGHLGIGEGDARDGGVVGLDLFATERASDQLAMVVGEVGEPPEAGDVTATVDSGCSQEGSWIGFQPAPLGLRQTRRLQVPPLEVGLAPGRHQQPFGRDVRPPLELDANTFS